MPLYDYKCDNGHVFEELQRFADDPIENCTNCGSPAKRQLSVPMVLYKGSGFYTTDYGRNGSATNNGKKSEEKSETSSTDTKSQKSSKESSSSSKE